ncbi:MAG: Gfo/Idh/MocA family oxidoreductase [Candidatus Endonucleobacter bathymodioli]|uniref:Gfo/Idh/MocA family oxidoreductase n=1 Tax=Candidatus Endonucleibacter bathymodioli TaxID=539814 RepID=A0AA90NW72_9GAMM|nr:Gfo/Idh/MocA family oxidoreductase [Candidatus Endonucleobacter bathymodioli]
MMPDEQTKGVKSLKVAFLGGGCDSAVGQVHRVAIGMDRRFELVAGCFSRDIEKNAETARQYVVELSRVYSSHEELLVAEKSKIDAVIILTPTNSHVEQVAACIEADMPVICEKALVSSLEDARKIEELINDKQAYLAVTYNYTGYPMLRELRHMIDRGAVGKVQQVQIEMPQEGFIKQLESGGVAAPQGWRLQDEKISTVSLDLGAHLHAIISFLTGEEPIELVSLNNSYGGFEQVVDSVMCMAKYSNNLSCNIWYTKAALGYRNGLKVRVFGDRGAAEWCQANPEDLSFCDEYGRKMLLDRASPEIEIANQLRYTRFKAGHPAGFIEAFANYYCDIADTLEKYLQDRKPLDHENVFGVSDSVGCMHMLEAISDSSANSGWIKVQ